MSKGFCCPNLFRRYARTLNSNMDHPCLKCVGVDDRQLVNLDLQRGQPESLLAATVFGYAPGPGERDVCLHLALF